MLKEALSVVSMRTTVTPQQIADVAGYLLTLVDRSRREALNRAKREPFVIYMMSVQSDLAMRRAGLDPELKDRIAAAWRAEDYHRAAALIPDELLDAFMLVGTREQVAAGALAFRALLLRTPTRRRLALARALLHRGALDVAEASCRVGLIGGLVGGLLASGHRALLVQVSLVAAHHDACSISQRASPIVTDHAFRPRASTDHVSLSPPWWT